MFRSFWPLAILLLCALTIKAQSEKKYVKPDYPAIKRLTKDKTLNSYYPKLYSRYVHNDTTLTDQDFRLLYYGYCFQPGYHSISSHAAYRDSLKILSNKDELTAGEMDKLIKYTKEELKKQPYDLENIHRLCSVYQMMGANDSVAFYLFKLKMIARTIFSTGDGASESNSIYVLTTDDEFSVLHLLGYEFDGRQSHISDHCNYLGVKKNEDNIPGLYFEIEK